MDLLKDSAIIYVQPRSTAGIAPLFPIAHFENVMDARDTFWEYANFKNAAENVRRIDDVEEVVIEEFDVV